MAGVLQFTLGLEASKFLDTIGIAGHKILGLAGVGEMVRTAFEKAWGQIEKGAALENLSKRTGVAVGQLFMLQKSFKAVGIDSEGVSQAIFMLNKSLGGVNDMGEDTTSIFAKAGLSLESLKKAGGAGAIQQVLQAMSGMSQTSATAFASKVFGRGMAGDMVQASRSMKEFNEAMAGARAQAAVFQRVAAVFDYIEKAVVRLKAKLDPLFLVIAEKIAPALKAVVDWVNAIDLTPLSDAIGNAFDVLAEAFKQGKIMELLGKGFEAAVEYLGNLLFGVLGSGQFWSGIWNYMVGEFEVKIGVIAKAFLNLGVILKAGIATAFQELFALIGKTPKLGKWLGLEGYTAGGFSANYAAERDNARGANEMLDSLIGSGAGGMKRGASGIAGAIAEAHANAGGPAQDAFNDLIDGLLGPRKRGTRTAGKGAAGTELDLNIAGGKGTRPDVSALEKMGFVLGTGVGLGPAETTARNTTKMAEHLGKLVEFAGKRADGNELTNAHPI